MAAARRHASTAGRWLRTLRHLRAAQVFHRLRLAARRRHWSRVPERIEARYRRAAAQLPEPGFDHPGLVRLAELRVRRVAAEESLEVARGALAGRFEFLGVTREFGADVDWYRQDLDAGTRLWKTLLHEFPYALDLARAHADSGDPAFRLRFFELVRSWRRASPIAREGFALDCWNSRAVARRMLAWAAAGAILRLGSDEPDARFLSAELGVHALFLRDNLEWDLRANHLLSDLTALSIAHALLGCAPEALPLLERQLDEQILADGCHEELVPLYHAVALQELVEVREVLGGAAPAWLANHIGRMAGFLAHLLPDDGRLPLLGDTWHGEVDPLRVLAEAGAAAAAPDPQVVAGASGLVVLRAGDAHAVVRAGRHGPDHQLGHAHADGLSLEASLGRCRVVTDTGTPTYDAGPLRDRARSTAAHNTVQIAGEEQIEAWGSFRVGRRGRGRVDALGEAGGLPWVQATHSGWRWLAGRPLHRRLALLCPTALLVVDAVEGSGRQRLRSALHLHPDRPETVRVVALGALAREAPFSLHERWGESRSATEVFVEAEAGLPWASGWWVVFDAGSEAPAAELHTEEGLLRVRCRHPRAAFELCWRPDAEGERRVELSRCSSFDASAT